jgi:hypothetical protein
MFCQIANEQFPLFLVIIQSSRVIKRIDKKVKIEAFPIISSL